MDSRSRRRSLQATAWVEGSGRGHLPRPIHCPRPTVLGQWYVRTEKTEKIKIFSNIKVLFQNLTNLTEISPQWALFCLMCVVCGRSGSGWACGWVCVVGWLWFGVRMDALLVDPLSGFICLVRHWISSLYRKLLCVQSGDIDCPQRGEYNERCHPYATFIDANPRKPTPRGLV